MIPYILLLIILLTVSALCAGLTIGLMGLGTYELLRSAKNGDKEAEQVYAVRKYGTQLLATLLLANVALNAFISIILSKLFTGLVAGLIATALIFILAEMIPQAVMSRYALWFGARTAWFVKLLLIILHPICRPIAFVLDKFLGHEVPDYYTKRELLSVIDEYETSNPESAIDKDEQQIARGALSFSHQEVEHVMTPNTVVVMLDESQTFDETIIETLKNSGFSRIPVFRKDHNSIVGILYIKDLVGLNITGKKVGEFVDPDFYTVLAHDKLDTVLNTCIEKHMHLLIVQDEFGGFEGVITLEDILEQIVGREIIDEDDKHPDLRQVAKRIVESRTKKPTA